MNDDRLWTISSGPWSRHELDVLRSNYASVDNDVLIKMLPGRSASSIQIRANRLGLTKSVRKVRDRRWTEDMDATMLAEIAAGKSYAQAAAAVPVSRGSVCGRTHRLRKRVQRGSEVAVRQL